MNKRRRTTEQLMEEINSENILCNQILTHIFA